MSNTLLSNAQVAATADIEVYDARGNRIRFGALFELEQTIVVFIRHFFCGSCQQYVTQLSTVRPEALEAACTKLVIIGCGDWILINNYREMTSTAPHPLISYYADPSRTLYRTIGLTISTLARTPQGAPRKKYLSSGIFTNTTRSIFRALRNPLHVGKQGNLSQLGGEFILGPKNTCSFAHYMQHTEDHTEVADLFRTAGVAYP